MRRVLAEGWTKSIGGWAGEWRFWRILRLCTSLAAFGCRKYRAIVLNDARLGLNQGGDTVNQLNVSTHPKQLYCCVICHAVILSMPF